MRQIPLFKNETSLTHGGEFRRGKRKTRRPLSSKRPLHCVLKSKLNVLFANKEWIERNARRLSDKFCITAYAIAVNHDHIHLVLRIPGRREYKAFLRSLTSLLARKFGKGLFSLLPFTRVAAWGRDFRSLLDYLRKNREEAEGIRPYEERKHHHRTRKKPQGP